MFVLTSYDDKKTKTIYPIDTVGAGTIAAMKNCADETRVFASKKDPAPPPQNTRSDPADRIRRFREGIGNTKMPSEERDKVRKSEYYQKSLKFLLQCVLAQVYGEKVTIKSLNVGELVKKSAFPGRSLFIDAILRALDMGNDKIYTLRNRAGNIVGLLSKTGPIPVVENEFLLPELHINETNDIKSILDSLSVQDKELLAFWLLKDTESYSLLYDDLKEALKTHSRTDPNLSKINEMMQIEKINEKIAGFPVLKEFDHAILCDKITIVPVNDNKVQFGYEMHPLHFESEGLCYVFLPPLTSDAVAATATEDFTVKKIEVVTDKTVIEKNKLVAITIRCELKNKHLEQVVRSTYTGGEIRYVKNFPSITIYGPVPERGWIARRDIDIGDYPSPLKSGSVENISFKDIVFDEEMEDNFLETTDKYRLYRGKIPLWSKIKTSTGDTLGGLPLRVVPSSVQNDWKNMPNFIHNIQKDNPSGRLVVAADIGSSRIAILFRRIGDSENEYNEILIDDGQPMGIPVTTSGSITSDVNFGMMIFQPEKQLGKVEGKTPIGLLTTDAFHAQKKDQVALFSSGKLILLDPKSISDAGNRKIISDIKVGKPGKVEDNQKAMYLLVQGLITLIVDRAVHLECNTIELRLSYLVERYSSFVTAWKKAIDQCKEDWPEITIDLNMYLPESLAIANRLKSAGKLTTMSGAAIIDIGDFTTDIALFINKSGQVVLKNNFSVQFAGRQIILQPIWDYLLFSGDKIENLYKPEMMKLSECKQAVARLEDARQKRILNDDVRRDLLCLMSHLNGQKIPESLRNLFDICYLTEIVILKRILRNESIEEGHGEFDVHLFGGGQFLIKANKEGYDWNKVLRPCKTNTELQKVEKGKTLALGLLQETDATLEEAANKMKQEAEEYILEDKNNNRIDVNLSQLSNEFLNAYICFLQNAQALKKWVVLDANNNRVSPGKLFNVKKLSKNSDGVIDNEDLYRENYDKALEFAMAGIITDIEIVKTLFAYKMAYGSAVAFYSRKN